MHPRRVTPLLAILVVSTILAAPAKAKPGRWTRIGPDAASVTVLAAAPSRPTTVYAGLQVGGVFRSTDGGRTWVWASKGLAPIYAVRGMAIDPTAPRTVFITGPLGLHKTTNGGESWKHVASSIRSVAVHPRNGRIVYALPWDGPIRRSTNGGATWTELPSGSPRDAHLLRFDPLRPETLYVAALDGTSLFKSADGGRTWTEIGRGLTPELDIRELEVDPLSPRTLYASLSTTDPDRDLFKSVDGGETWAPIRHGLGELPFTLAGVTAGAGRTAVFGIMDRHLYRSLNGGLSWSAVDTGLPGSPAWFGERVVSASGALLAPTSEGIFRSADGGSAWSPSSRNLDTAYIGNVAGGSSLYAGVVAQGVFESADGGATWRRLPLDPEASVRFLGPMVAESGRIFAVTGTGIARSEDDGASWSVSESGCLRVEKIAVDPAAPETLYILGNAPASSSCSTEPLVCGLQKSTDSGRTWTCSSHGLPAEKLSLVAIDPHRTSTLFVRAGRDLYRSTNGGSSWSLHAVIRETAMAPRVLAFDPRDSNRMYAGVFSGVTRSTDGGRTWTRFTQGFPGRDAVLDLEIDPADPETLYAMTSASGVFKSTDGGETWSLAGAGLDGLHAVDLHLDPQDRSTLYVATRGEGLWKFVQGVGRE